MIDPEAQRDNPPSPDNPILTFECSAVCNACGQSFTLPIHDENPDHAKANFLTVLIPLHGSFGGEGISLCTHGGGKSTDGYSQITAIQKIKFLCG